MKLKNRNKSKKILVIVAIIVAVLLVIGLVAGIVTMSVKKSHEEKGKIIKQLYIAVYPEKREYYVGEEFDPTGIEIQAATANGSNKFLDYTQVTFTGFDSSVPVGKQTITVTCQGVSTTFDVIIKESPSATPILKSIEVKGFKTTYQIDNWNKYGPNLNNVYIECTYSDGSVKNEPLQHKYLYNVVDVDAPGEYQITVKYTDGGISAEQAITITITK